MSALIPMLLRSRGALIALAAILVLGGGALWLAAERREAAREALQVERARTQTQTQATIDEIERTARQIRETNDAIASDHANGGDADLRRSLREGTFLAGPLTGPGAAEPSGAGHPAAIDDLPP